VPGAAIRGIDQQADEDLLVPRAMRHHVDRQIRQRIRDPVAEQPAGAAQRLDGLADRAVQVDRAQRLGTGRREALHQLDPAHQRLADPAELGERRRRAVRKHELGEHVEGIALALRELAEVDAGHQVGHRGSP
jgi:hypothetical protein